MMSREVTAEDLEALNMLVQLGLVDVVTIEDGEPFYTLGSRIRPRSSAGVVGVVADEPENVRSAYGPRAGFS
jgi:hypothetical protein